MLMKFWNPNKTKFIFFFLVPLLVFTYITIFSDHGILQQRRYHKILEELLGEKKRIQIENSALENQIRSFESNPSKILYEAQKLFLLNENHKMVYFLDK